MFNKILSTGTRTNMISNRHVVTNPFGVQPTCTDIQKNSGDHLLSYDRLRYDRNDENHSRYCFVVAHSANVHNSGVSSCRVVVAPATRSQTLYEMSVTNGTVYRLVRTRWIRHVRRRLVAAEEARARRTFPDQLNAISRPPATTLSISARYPYRVSGYR